MNEKSLFSIPSAAPRPGALERVLASLYARQQQSRLWRVRVFAATASLSVIALIPAAISLARAFAASNFAAYVSLAFSDSSVLASYWKEIGVSLVESLPAVSLMLTLALIGTFLWSLRGMVRFTSNRNFINA